jgi:hypothetical protein
MGDSRSPRREAADADLEEIKRSTCQALARIGFTAGASRTSPRTDGRTTGSRSNAPKAGKLEELVSPHRNCRGEKKSRYSPGKAAPMTRRAADLSNRRFGAWLVLRRSSSPKVMWQCQCDCGTVRSVVASSLMTGASRSCGCRRRDLNPADSNPNQMATCESSEPELSRDDAAASPVSAPIEPQ